MSVELTYLALTALLNSILWIPVVIGKVETRGFLQPQDYVVDPKSPLRNWANRANRAHLNAVENFSPFAATVLIAAVISFSTPLTQILAAVYFWGRLVHVIVHISGFNKIMARTVVFSIANIAAVIYIVLVVLQLLAA